MIEEVIQGVEGVWTAKIDPQRLIKLANPVRQGNRLNVVMVTRPSYDADTHSLQFDLDSALLLNLGNTFETVLIDSREEELDQPSPTPHPIEQVRPSSPTPQGRKRVRPDGDTLYLIELRVLPDSLREVGEQLLAEIRKEFPGELVFHPKSKKFVESPDNFWVVRIQPRAQSLRIIVYGRPEEHGKYHSIDIKRDMASYSSFVVDTQRQVSDAVKVIREAKRLKDIR
jgi:hypothetical protein